MSMESDLDTKALEKLEKTGGPQFVCQIIDIFLQYIPEKLAEARAGLQTDNLETVRLAVHPIKSSASNLGATTVKDLATRLEQLAANQQRETIPSLLHELEEAYARVRLQLEAKRRELS